MDASTNEYQSLKNIIKKTILTFPEAEKLNPKYIDAIISESIDQKKLQDASYLSKAIEKYLEKQEKETPEKKPPEIKISKPQVISSQEELLEVADKHAKWINYVLSPTKHNEDQNFQRANLENSKLVDLDLSNLNLSCANLNNVSFENSKLVNTIFSRASMLNTHFKKAILHKTNFKNAKLEGANFLEAEIVNCNFTGINLDKIKMEETYKAEIKNL